MTLNDLLCETMGLNPLCIFLVPAATDIDFISYAVGKIMLRHFTKKCVGSRASKLFITVHLVKLIGRGFSIFFECLVLCYL